MTQAETTRSPMELLIFAVRIVLGLGFLGLSAYAFYEAGLAVYKLDLARTVGAYFVCFCTVGLGPFFWPFSWPFGDGH